MHDAKSLGGDTWRAHLGQLTSVIPDLRSKTILDFDCGPKGGLAAEFGSQVTSYDPYVSQFSSDPWSKKFDVLFSSDVLEHMTKVQIRSLTKRIREAGPSYVFLIASTRAAHKRLPNGANAHLTIQPARWWLRFLSQELGEKYRVTLASSDLIREDVALCFTSNAV